MGFLFMTTLYPERKYKKITVISIQRAFCAHATLKYKFQQQFMAFPGIHPFLEFYYSSTDVACLPKFNLTSEYSFVYCCFVIVYYE